WTLAHSPSLVVLSAPYCSANTIPSHGVRNRRAAPTFAFWCHPACFIHLILFSTLNRSPTTRSTEDVIAGDANTHTDARSTRSGLVKSSQVPIHARNSPDLAHWLSHSSCLTLK